MLHFFTPWKRFQGVQECNIGRIWVKYVDLIPKVICIFFIQQKCKSKRQNTLGTRMKLIKKTIFLFKLAFLKWLKKVVNISCAWLIAKKDRDPIGFAKKDRDPFGVKL